jgi:hypothetical protein
VVVIRKFSRSLLATEHRIGPGFVQRPPEAQYQDEFYRCSHSYSKGSVVTFPEFGTKSGRVDFFPPNSGVWNPREMVLSSDSIPLGFHDQDHMEQHSVCPTTLSLTAVSTILNYHIHVCLVYFSCLLFRLLNISSESDLPNLYHVVFSDGFECTHSRQ